MGFSRLRQGNRRPAILAAVLAALGLSLAAATALAHPFHPGASVVVDENPSLALDRIGSFDYPVFVTSPRRHHGRQFVVEQDGQIRLIKNGQVQSRAFLNVSSLIDFNGGERGLLSMAFAPDYAESRLLYIFYTDRGGDLRVDEFKRSATNPDAADAGSRRAVIRIEHSEHGNHNGGQLQFAPGASASNLYVSTGDGGGGGDPYRAGQNRDTLLGKILRINPRRSGSRSYTVPAGNPYVGRAGRDEIWHYGLRNPWRFSFDRANGNMAIGDVGQSQKEEVDFVRAGRGGANFGWNCFEGTLPYNRSCSAPGHVRPVVQYAHEGASCSITGGYVVRDPGLASLAGKYLYGDYCTGALHAATVSEGQATVESESASNRFLDLIVPRLTGFGEDAQGRVYMTSRSYDGRPGALYRLRATP